MFYCFAHLKTVLNAVSEHTLKHCKPQPNTINCYLYCIVLFCQFPLFFYSPLLNHIQKQQGFYCFIRCRKNQYINYFVIALLQRKTKSLCNSLSLIRLTYNKIGSYSFALFWRIEPRHDSHRISKYQLLKQAFSANYPIDPTSPQLYRHFTRSPRSGIVVPFLVLPFHSLTTILSKTFAQNGHSFPVGAECPRIPFVGMPQGNRLIKEQHYYSINCAKYAKKCSQGKNSTF